METLDVLLLDILCRHEAHIGATGRFTDGLRVGRIMLVALSIGSDVMRSHDARLVSKSPRKARPMVSCAAGLGRHYA